MTAPIDPVYRSSTHGLHSQSESGGIVEPLENQSHDLPPVLLRVPVIENISSIKKASLTDMQEEEDPLNANSTARVRVGENSQPGLLHRQLKKSRWKSQTSLLIGIAVSVILVFLTWRVFQSGDDSDSISPEMTTTKEPLRRWRNEPNALFSDGIAGRSEPSEVPSWGSEQEQFTDQKNEEVASAFHPPAVSGNVWTEPTSVGNIPGNRQELHSQEVALGSSHVVLPDSQSLGTRGSREPKDSGPLSPSAGQLSSPYPTTDRSTWSYPDQTNMRKPAHVASRPQFSLPRSNARSQKSVARLKGNIEKAPIQSNYEPNRSRIH